jgi:hypothetical protein
VAFRIPDVVGVVDGMVACEIGGSGDWGKSDMVAAAPVGRTVATTSEDARPSVVPHPLLLWMRRWFSSPTSPSSSHPFHYLDEGFPLTLCLEIKCKIELLR